MRHQLVCDAALHVHTYIGTFLKLYSCMYMSLSACSHIQYGLLVVYIEWLFCIANNVDSAIMVGWLYSVCVGWLM